MLVGLTRQLSNCCRIHGLVGTTTDLPASLEEELEEVEPIAFQGLMKLKLRLVNPPEALQRLLDSVHGG